MIDISPDCDCWDFNDVSVVPDVGIAASFDPVALDMACADMVNEAHNKNMSLIAKKDSTRNNEDDLFRQLYPNVDWKVALLHAEKCGLGSTEYKLIHL